MAMTEKELRSAIEALLFIAGEPVTPEELFEAFPDEGKDAVSAQLAEIEKIFSENVGGFHLERAAGGYRFATRPELDPILKKFFARKGEGRLSIAALETLSIIAYRQPVTAPEVSDIRGVNSSGVLRTLLERKLIRIAGRKNVVGSPFLYRTTQEFLTHFGLNSVQDLPRLEEFSEILGENVTDDFLGEVSSLDTFKRETSTPDGTATDGADETESAESDETELGSGDVELHVSTATEAIESAPDEADDDVETPVEHEPVEI